MFRFRLQLITGDRNIIYRRLKNRIMGLQKKLQQLADKYGVKETEKFQTETTELIIKVVADMINISSKYGFHKKTITTEFILDTVAEIFGIEKEMLFLKSRKREIVVPRQFASLMLKDQGLTDEEIGTILDKERTTIWHGVSVMRDLISVGMYENEVKQYQEAIAAPLFIDKGEAAPSDCEI